MLAKNVMLHVLNLKFNYCSIRCHRLSTVVVVFYSTFLHYVLTCRTNLIHNVVFYGVFLSLYTNILDTFDLCEGSGIYCFSEHCHLLLFHMQYITLK